MATINLAPGTQYIAAIRRRQRTLFSLSAGIIIAVVLVWAGLFLLNQAAEKNLLQTQGELSALERSLAEMGPDVERITLFEERLAALDSLLDHHSRYTPLLQEIERLLPPPTVLTTLAVNTQRGVAEMTGTTPNIDEVAQTLASLTASPGRATVFNQAELQSIVRNEIKSVEGGPTLVEYIFTAKFPFDAKILYEAAR